jgi:DNA-directed RNA polymerase subunit RPC12/RpoP
MPKKNEKLYTVRCAYCGKEFPKLIEIVEGSESTKTNQEAYCPFCKKMVSFSIQGKPAKEITYKNLETD